MVSCETTPSRPGRSTSNTRMKGLRRNTARTRLRRANTGGSRNDVSGVERRRASGRKLTGGDRDADELDGEARGNGIGRGHRRRARHGGVVAIVAGLDRRVTVVAAADARVPRACDAGELRGGEEGARRTQCLT